ncbi:MAG: 2Fe-2S iron-sulfur cluster-binding protein [Actinomycetota bacterium]|nr:2Fe-2S iron-sulfur cluster-binding protein [Actinomycetota bacterium]MDA2971399.1 2Fe-2S iron-sulfur cluster-binding protein [Actinomycetota bacterium]
MSTREPVVNFELDGRPVSVSGLVSLLAALRDQLGVRSAKDGCAPQGQCGCCTVWVDGEPRVSCVTPVSRVSGRRVTTIDGLGPTVRDEWARAFCATGGSQCGFCTPGIVMRLAAERHRSDDRADIASSLTAHLCRCTGWQTVIDAATAVATGVTITDDRDFDAASRRATIEGRSTQVVSPRVALGEGGFADDAAPDDAWVAVLAPDDSWSVARTVTEARAVAGVVPGRRSTLGVVWPIDPPVGDFVRTLSTTWVEPAYLEPDAVWCRPGGEPFGPTENGGAFGSKCQWLRDAARRLADENQRPVRVVLSREDVVRRGAKRPVLAAGVRADGSGVIVMRRTEGAADLVRAVAPDWELREVDLLGPPTTLDRRGAVWAEIAVLRSSVSEAAWDHVISPDGAEAWARMDDDAIRVKVRCGQVLDRTVLRSYCVGAAHMALGWVRSEGVAVDESGAVHDLTIRSFGVVRASDTPLIEVEILDDDTEPINGSDAVFAAVAAAVWRFDEWPARWPKERDLGDR